MSNIGSASFRLIGWEAKRLEPFSPLQTFDFSESGTVHSPPLPQAFVFVDLFVVVRRSWKDETIYNST